MSISSQKARFEFQTSKPDLCWLAQWLRLHPTPPASSAPSSVSSCLAICCALWHQNTVHLTCKPFTYLDMLIKLKQLNAPVLDFKESYVNLIRAGRINLTLNLLFLFPGTKEIWLHSFFLWCCSLWAHVFFLFVLYHLITAPKTLFTLCPKVTKMMFFWLLQLNCCE